MGGWKTPPYRMSSIRPKTEDFTIVSSRRDTTFEDHGLFGLCASIASYRHPSAHSSIGIIRGKVTGASDHAIGYI